MKADVCDSWIRLEHILVQCCNLLLPHSSYKPISFPRPPSSYFNSAVHDSESVTRERIIAGRDAFLPLSALLLFLISQLEDVQPFKLGNEDVILPRWIGILAIHHRVHMPTVERDLLVRNMQLEHSQMRCHSRPQDLPVRLPFLQNGSSLSTDGLPLGSF